MIATCSRCGVRFEGRPDRVMSLQQAHERECRLRPRAERHVEKKARWWR